MFTTPLATTVSVVLVILVIYLIIKKLFKILVYLLLVGLAYYGYQKYIAKKQINVNGTVKNDTANKLQINNTHICAI
jgi:hypothetical protein